MAGLERRCNPDAELRMEEDESKNILRFVGYAAVFNSLSVDFGGWKEVIRPGAFKRSLGKNPDVRFLINHGDLPLARSPRTMTLQEDNRGLRVEAELDLSDPDVQRLRPKMKRGDVSQMSFAFRTIQDDKRRESDFDLRELIEVDIDDGDVSVVTYPAYQATNFVTRSVDLTVGSQEISAWKKQLDEQEARALAEIQHKARERHLRLLKR